MTVHILYILYNHPTFHSEERLINLERGGECFVDLSISLVYAADQLISPRDMQTGPQIVAGSPEYTQPRGQVNTQYKRFCYHCCHSWAQN